MASNQNHKANKIETYRDKYFTTCVFEYRGYKYEVEYANGWNVCCTPAWVQHKDKQEEIDEMIDNPKPIAEKESKPFDLDEIWEILGW